LSFDKLRLAEEDVYQRFITMGLSLISSSAGSFAAPSTKMRASERSSAALTATNTEKSGSETQANPPENKPQSQLKLSEEALAQLVKLKARDRQVRQHEAAHLAAAGGLATSSASFTYQKGPDGVSYAIGGEVGIDVSPGRTPAETIARARTIQAAALAPAEPSGADLAVAAKAQQMGQQAQAELVQQKNELSKSKTDQGANMVRAYRNSDGTGSHSLSAFA